MKLFTPRPTDDEYVANIRKSVAFCDRWRTTLIVVFALIAGVEVWVFKEIVPFLMRAGQPGNANWMLGGFVIGACLGLVLGWAFHKLAIGLLEAALGEMRTERLLIEHYQPSKSEPSVADEPVPDEANREWRELAREFD